MKVRLYGDYFTECTGGYGLKAEWISQKENLSREQYIMDLLEQDALSEDLIQTKDRYENLVRDMMDVMSSMNTYLEENNLILQKVMGKLYVPFLASGKE